jgi:TonB family protein
MLKSSLLLAMIAALSLQAAPQDVRDAQGVEVRTEYLKILHRTPIEYPAEARAKAISGEVVAAVNLDAQGEVTDARIVSGPQELRAPVLRSLLGWHFVVDPGTGGQAPLEVAIRFTAPAGGVDGSRLIAPPPADFTVDRIDLSALPVALREKVEAAMPVRTGEIVTRDRYAEVERSLRAVDGHLTLSTSIRGDKSDRHATLTVTVPQGNRVFTDVQGINVGGSEQAAKLVQKVTPKYPVEAKAARIQGLVRMRATIAKDGTIKALDVISGAPELVPSALEAVRQWVYRPTLLNGEPVAVITQIDVNYTLAP